MKEEIPESFWEALVEVKDKDIENARELFLTAMELAKKYKDQRDELERENEQLLASNKTYEHDWPILVHERNEYKIGHDRYEKLRRLNLQQIKELYLKNLRTGEHFDILVDKL